MDFHIKISHFSPKVGTMWGQPDEPIKTFSPKTIKGEVGTDGDKMEQHKIPRCQIPGA